MWSCELAILIDAITPPQIPGKVLHYHLVLVDLSLPVPPNMCMSICSRRHITKVLTWGSNPKRKMTGKHKANTVGQKRKLNYSSKNKYRYYYDVNNQCGESYIKTNQWAHPWHRAGSLQRRRWLHKGRKVAGCQSAQKGRRSRSSRNTSKSRPADCTQWSSYGPIKE